jgi:beta-glucosidase
VPVEADERTDFGWPVAPEGLTAILLALHQRYPDLPPVVVTESGASFHDAVSPDGQVHDERRIRYVDAHLRAVLAALDAGVDVRGFYVWSAFDNFEWAAGYQERFGLVHVDLDTQVRTRKDSGTWYRDLIAAQQP